MSALSIITLSRNPCHMTRLLDRLDRQTDPPPYDAILVNNDHRSVGLTVDTLRRGWLVIEPGYNTSFSVGNNMAARAVEGEWLLLLNDDLVLHDSRFLATLWQAREKAEILGALLLHADGTVNHAGTTVSTGRGAALGRTDHIGRGAPALGFYQRSCYVPSVTFAAALIKRDLWDRLGGLDERYYYGWEDTDFCLRALREGARIWCERGAVATHDECGTRPRGGRHDAQNASTFISTWQAILPDLLDGYARRMLGQPLEGIA